MAQTLSDDQKAIVEQFRQQAMAYVWGWQDRAGSSERDTEESIGFGRAYADHAEAFFVGEIGFRDNIGRAYANWSSGKDISAQS